MGINEYLKRNKISISSIQTLQSRILAEDFYLKEDIDYFDTYAFVAKIISITILFTLASIFNLNVYQMDVKW